MLVDQDVAGLQVQVQHAEAMRVVDGLGHRAQKIRGLERRQRAFGVQPLRQAASAHQLHRVEDAAPVLAHLVHDDDIGVLQQRRVLRFAPEAVDEFVRGALAGRQQLDCNFAPQIALARAVDDTHAAAPDRFDQFVVAEFALGRVVEIEFAEIRFGQVAVQQRALRHRGRFAGWRAARAVTKGEARQ